MCSPSKPRSSRLAVARAWHMRAARVRVHSRAKAKAELLVDGDQRGIEAAKEAIDQLQTSGWEAHTTVFAEPGRVANKKWKAFFQEPDVSFVPVPRSAAGEASDVAIERKLRDLAQSMDDVCVALLTADTDFVDALVNVTACGKEVLVFIPQATRWSAGTYRRAGVQVQLVRDQHKFDRPGPKVRAVLCEDGHGTVQFAGSWKHPDHETSPELLQLLQDLGYYDQGGYFAPSIAKFGFVNNLTPLTVFPAQCGCQELHRYAIQSPGRPRSWKPYRTKLGFFLPVSSPRSATREKLRKYGSMLSNQVYNGGGPFLIKDSADMVARALRKMGYLDDDFNADLPEAMLVFANMPQNKRRLRKECCAQPAPTDTASDVNRKLRGAFLSAATDGKWRIAPKDAAVRRELFKQGFLTEVAAPQVAVQKAMKAFSRSRHLQEMRSYNGYVFQIQRYMTPSDPSRTGMVEFRT